MKEWDDRENIAAMLAAVEAMSKGLLWSCNHGELVIARHQLCRAIIRMDPSYEGVIGPSSDRLLHGVRKREAP